MPEHSSRISFPTRAREWLQLELDASQNSNSSRPAKPRRLSGALMCIAIFVVAVGVRALHWQDSHVQIVHSSTSLMGVFNRYRKEADRILTDGAIVFPREQPAPGDARMLAHPPGYSILLAGIKWASSQVYESLWLIQITADGLAAILIFLIASKLFRRRIGLIAGMLVAISPQLAYYCLLLTPDSLAVLPLVASVYCLVVALKQPRLSYLIVSGALIGLSCWLGANAMGLVLFLGLLVPFLFQSGRRIRYSAAVVSAGIIVIAPITIRNWIAYHRLIPISIQAGLSLAEGIGDFDREGKLGMPRSDQEAREKDAEWSSRPEYNSSLWFPDGIERDHLRLSRGLAVIRSRPIWFLGVMLRRSAYMLRYNDSAGHGWPQDSSVVDLVQAQPPFSHELVYEPAQSADPSLRKVPVYDGQVLAEAAVVPVEYTVVWTASPSDLLATGWRLSPGASVAIEENSQVLAIAGDRSDYDNQFASEQIDVEPHTDYILIMRVTGSGGTMAIKVLSADMKGALSSASVSAVMTAAKAAKVGPKARGGDESSEPVPLEVGEVEIQMPFASGPETKLHIALSNNGQGAGPPVLGIREAKLIRAGPTLGLATRIPRIIIRGLQKALFTTSHMLILIFAGIVFCVLAKQFRSLVVALAVPFYYLAAQSLLHAEYRYVLGIHYFVFIAAAVALNCAFSLCNGLVRRFAGVPAHTLRGSHPHSVQ